MRARLLLVVAAVLSLQVSMVAAPRLEVGKVYEVAWSCQVVAVDAPTAGLAKTCYVDIMRVLAKGKDDWYEIEDAYGDRWHVNLRLAVSVREAKPPTTTRPKTEPSPENPRLTL